MYLGTNTHIHTHIYIYVTTIKEKRLWILNRARGSAWKSLAGGKGKEK